MTLEKSINKWQSIQPLSEADQNKLSMSLLLSITTNA